MAIDLIITNYRHLLVSRRSILFFSLRLRQVVIGSPVIILNISLSNAWELTIIGRGWVLIRRISKSKQRILFHTPLDMPNSPYHIKPNLTFFFSFKIFQTSKHACSDRCKEPTLICMFLGKFRDAPSLEDIPQRSSNSTFVICRVVVFLALFLLCF